MVTFIFIAIIWRRLAVNQTRRRIEYSGLLDLSSPLHILVFREPLDFEQYTFVAIIFPMLHHYFLELQSVQICLRFKYMRSLFWLAYSIICSFGFRFANYSFSRIHHHPALFRQLPD